MTTAKAVKSEQGLGNRALLEKMDKLRELGISNMVPLPQVMHQEQGRKRRRIAARKKIKETRSNATVKLAEHQLCHAMTPWLTIIAKTFVSHFLATRMIASGAGTVQT
ncbi:hypothetical protein ACJA88_014837 [Fusarium oxysporum]